MTKILVIEDEPRLRIEVIEWLKFEGYEVIGAADGVEGVEAALRERPDLIVCDITMPRLDGYGVLLEIQANPATIGIPFIFLTARATYDDLRKGMTIGADDYITKPFTLDQLLQSVRIRLEKKAAKERQYLAEIEALTQTLRKEQEQREIKARLIAMFSHDFRNPLTGIFSSNSLLRDYGDRMDPERRLMHMNRIDNLVRLLIQMLDDLLVSAQMESGSFEYKPSLVEMDDFLRTLIDEFQTLYGESRRIVLDCHSSDYITADPQLLRHIMANLISNAVKYSSAGTEIRVTAARQDLNYVISVQDHGIGIPEADQALLFDAFQRGSNVNSISGTGLGLAIVKQAVELHGGSVSVESAVGHGTTMTITIPVDAARKS